jgi:hypothetical protein
MATAKDSKEYVSTRRQFHKYKNNILVESGTHQGDGVQDALNCGFKSVITFEISKPLLQKSRDRFKYNLNVKIIDDSSVNMFEYIKDIKEPVTFWLDGHWSGSETTYKDDHCPILKELDAIAKHPIKTHTIMVDDVRLFGTTPGVAPNPNSLEFRHVTLQQIIAKVKTINPNYKIMFEDGYSSNDIMVFHL